MANTNSNKAVKNAWRFLALVYLLMLSFFLAFPIGRSILPKEFGSAMLLTTYMLFCLVIAFCFALAAVGWALWSFRRKQKANLTAPFWVFLTAVMTTLVLGAYALVFMGLVRF
jgi:hypothetical protein